MNTPVATPIATATKTTTSKDKVSLNPYLQEFCEAETKAIQEHPMVKALQKGNTFVEIRTPRNYEMETNKKLHADVVYIFMCGPLNHKFDKTKPKSSENRRHLFQYTVPYADAKDLRIFTGGSSQYDYLSRVMAVTTFHAERVDKTNKEYKASKNK